MLNGTDISVLLIVLFEMVLLNDPFETYKKNKRTLGGILESVIHQRETIHRFVSAEHFPPVRLHAETMRTTVHIFRRFQKQLCSKF